MQPRHVPELQTERFVDPISGFDGFRVRVDGPQRGIPTPAMQGGRVYFGGGFGSYDVFAVDMRSGDLAWRLRTTDDGPTAVTVSGRWAAYNTESCTIEVVDTESGERVWSRWLGDPLLAQPAIDGERLFMAWPQNGAHVLGAFAVADGAPIWQRSLEHDVISAPIVCDGAVYVSQFDGSVMSIEIATGNVVWKRELRATSAPWIVGGDVYVAQRSAENSGPRSEPNQSRTAETDGEELVLERTANLDGRYGRRKSVTASKPARYYAQRWAADAKAAAADLDGSVGFATPPAAAKMDKIRALLGEGTIARAWRHQGSRPVVWEGVLFETTGDELEARSIASGETLWRWRGAEAHDGNRALTPPAVANGRVLAGTGDGRVIAWDALTGAVRFTVHVGAAVHWQPVMSAGRVAVGLEDSSLVVFDTNDSANDGWPMWGGGPGHNGPTATKSASVAAAA
ncbi:PQQ-binding-like beta-propeller repeat protein [Candidatus Viadribacter manganicus]|uniref:Pyrrolo-quinoline quinone repeat domain-containing protein n=1 Tax=Candidatus Viadribacter manganicus TaxID=1759059 RepID=A0A1B1AHM2_9PROT|nr:PQQ-binding-like beta-propeller repeat protein [Candidatus Viadribacter manganicus]ANP46069.1 hypothetical protein ATE48_09115 [Candidatus Viadribacter manganicus]